MAKNGKIEIICVNFTQNGQFQIVKAFLGLHERGRHNIRSNLAEIIRWRLPNKL